VILGQTTKLSDRVRYRAVYDRLERRQEPAGQGKAKEAADG